MIPQNANLPHRDACAGLAGLVVLQAVTLGALFSGTPPHPPVAIALFALGPFLGVSMALAVAALLAEPQGRLGTALGVLAVLTALVSYGPHKWLDPRIAELWPAVLGGHAFAVLYFQALLRRWRTVVDTK